MRKKIKELLNKEEGFTLVELLAVIVILGIIVAIAIPAIGNVIGDSQEDADAAETVMIEDAARLYYIEYEDGIEDGDVIGVDELIKEGYLEERGNEEPLEGGVTVTIEGNAVDYEYSGDATGTVVATP